MDRTTPKYYCRDESPDRAVCCRSQCNCYSDPCSLLQAFQNPNFQDPECLNRVIIPMLLVQLLQNQQRCHCVNRQASRSYHAPQRSLPRQRQRSFHEYQVECQDRPTRYDSHHESKPQDVHPIVQEVHCDPPSRYRSIELQNQLPPSIQYSDEDIKHPCDSRSAIWELGRRSLSSTRSYDFAGQAYDREVRPPSPTRSVIERCYWCNQQLYRYFDPDQNKRVFTHLPTHRGAILPPAGRSTYRSLQQMSLVDLSPFCPGKDMMLPCPFMCARNETTYSSSYRHPEIVAKEALMPKRSQPWDNGGESYQRNSAESLGRNMKPRREERVMFLKPTYCGPLGQPRRESSAGRRPRSRGSSSPRGPSRNASLDCAGEEPEVCILCCPPPQEGHQYVSRPTEAVPPRDKGSRPSVTFSPSTDQHVGRSSSGFRRRRRRSRSRGSSSSRSSRRRRSSSKTGHRRSRSRRHDEAHPNPYRQRRHSAPHKTSSRGSRHRRAKSDHELRVRRPRSRRSGRRGRSVRNSHSDPVMKRRRYPPQRSVYKTSYGDPAQHPYYEGPSGSHFRRQRTEL